MKNDLKFRYSKEKLNQIAFPLGGIGAGMICLEGGGAVSNVSLRHKAEVFNEALMFSALTIKNPNKENLTLILEGQVPKRKIFGPENCSKGLVATYGLPRFTSAEFSWEFPFANVALNAADCPLQASISGWSPFVPGDSDNSSLPVAALEFSFENHGDEAVEAVYSFNSFNFLKIPNGSQQIKKTDDGFTLIENGSVKEPWQKSFFNASCDDPAVMINPSWFRSGDSDSLAVLWREINSGECVCRSEINEEDPSPGASLYIPFKLNPGEKKKINIKFSWYTPQSNLRSGECSCKSKDIDRSLPAYAPWYAVKFKNIREIADYWNKNYFELKEKTLKFSECLYSNTLPEQLTEALSANLSILKSPTVLRQQDGRLWAWEGCCDDSGCCPGSCTHVWNYAQALPHLFPDLERSLRQTEFNENQAANGHQNFRASLPIHSVDHAKPAAADGQLGGIMKIYRDWRISADSEYLKSLWPKVKQSLNYCIETWDPEHLGVLIEPHHNTYDIEFWGADGMCSSFYLGALKAAVLMAEALGDDQLFYQEIYDKGREYVETELFNGEYFIQKIQWEGLRAGNPLTANTVMDRSYSSEAKALLEKEGPKYQYGEGCLSDGVLGAWMAEVCGIGEILDPAKVKSHLQAVYKYNFNDDLSRHINPYRSTYANANEGGLLLCTWPRGGALTLPFYFSSEVWTGIEYQVASHLMMFGCVEEGMNIVETGRKRYDGSIRNPFNEYECGHWYARAMSSYALLQGMTGIRYDALEKILYIDPKIEGDFTSFLCTATGYGLAGIKNGKAFLDVIDGKIEKKKFAPGRSRTSVGTETD